MMGAAGLMSFGGTFVFAWLTKGAPPSQGSESSQPTLAGQEALTLPWPEVGTTGAIVAGESDSEAKKAMTRKQLKSLVYEIRDNIQSYDNKLQSLKARERRLQMAHDALKEDIENLNNLRVELSSMVARLKSEREKLVKSRTKIGQVEKANLMSLAATYDKMDVSSAGKILINMCASGDTQTQKKAFGGKDSNMDDAVKILHYMTEKSKAALLAELVISEPKLAAALCERLKEIVDGE